MTTPVIWVNIIKEVLSSMTITTNYQPGRSSQITERLTAFDNSEIHDAGKYPLFAVVFPAKTKRDITGYFGILTIERIVIATLTNTEDTVLKRFQTGGTFQSILYPIYYEFLEKLSFHPSVNSYFFKHTFLENPGNQPVGSGVRDYIDSIEILNLEIPLNQLQNC